MTRSTFDVRTGIILKEFCDIFKQVLVLTWMYKCVLVVSFVKPDKNKGRKFESMLFCYIVYMFDYMCRSKYGVL